MVRQLIRRSLRGAAAAVFHYTGLRRAAALERRYRSGGRRVSILGYHRVVDDLDGEAPRSLPGSLISTRTFRRHLETAAAAGYEFGTMDDAVDVITKRRPAKKDLIVITFDDGYRDIYRHAYPILKSMGVPAILYLPASMIGTAGRFDHDLLFPLVSAASRSGKAPDALPAAARALLEPVFGAQKSVSQSIDDFIANHSSSVLREVTQALSNHFGPLADLSTPEIMNWDEARKMASDGFQFGSHTLGHVVLTFEGPLQIDREILRSKNVIERQLGTKVDHFSYCNGWYSEQIVRTLVRHGLRSAVTTEDLPNRLGASPFTLKRKMLWENFSIGPTGRYSSALTACHLDDVFGTLGLNRPMIGHRTQRIHVSSEASRITSSSGAEAHASGTGASS